MALTKASPEPAAGDITRPVPNGLLLPRLLAELKQAGVAPANVTVLNATGLHRPNESSGQWGDERAMLLTMGDGAIAKQAGSADPLGAPTVAVGDTAILLTLSLHPYWNTY